MKIKGFIKLLVFCGILAAAYYYWPWRVIRHPPGVLINVSPRQEDIPPKPLPDVEGWKLTAVAKYGIRARVLGTKRYHSGFGSDVVPVDVAVGWGRMSDQAVLDQFEITMGNRFFFYEWSNQPAIPEGEIMRSAANNHIISANADVKKVIGSLRTGQIVTMMGYLVKARTPDGKGFWNSSLQRDDTGNGACEVFYVEAAKAADTVPMD